MPLHPSTDHPDYGPQHRKDNSFTARMRFHQSWYRAQVLKAPYGMGPRFKSKTLYGNMLTEADGQRGLNFLTPHIYEIAKRRLALKKGGVEPFRLLCNMLSSQPMCFNLFGPLVDDLELGAKLMSSVLPGEVQQVDQVRLEYAPEPASDYLNDRTAFDAFVAYTRLDGAPAFVGIETKLVEPFSQKQYANSYYWEWTKRPDSPWPETAWSQLPDKQINQLWRDHLLAAAMRHSPRQKYTFGALMVVYHPLDEECVRALARYKTLLKPGDDTLIDMPLDRLVEVWKTVLQRPGDQRWLTDFSQRYLELDASQAEYDKNS